MVVEFVGEIIQIRIQRGKQNLTSVGKHFGTAVDRESEENSLREGSFPKPRISQEKSHGRKGKAGCLTILMVLVKEDESGILSLRFGYKDVKRDYERFFENVFTHCQ